MCAGFAFRTRRSGIRNFGICERKGEAERGLSQKRPNVALDKYGAERRAARGQAAARDRRVERKC